MKTNSTLVRVVPRACELVFNKPFVVQKSKFALCCTSTRRHRIRDKKPQEPLQGDDRAGRRLNKWAACGAAVATPQGTSLVTRSTERNRRLIRLPRGDMMRALKSVNTCLFMTTHKYHRPPGECRGRRLFECSRRCGVNSVWPRFEIHSVALY